MFLAYCARRSLIIFIASVQGVRVHDLGKVRQLPLHLELLLRSKLVHDHFLRFLFN